MNRELSDLATLAKCIPGAWGSACLLTTLVLGVQTWTRTLPLYESWGFKLKSFSLYNGHSAIMNLCFKYIHFFIDTVSLLKE